ncbi:unnamed protein product, partial [Phaeothamnion confervicola]
YFWYGEHVVAAPRLPFLAGGVGACSTDDFETWRLEGIMLHHANLSDMVWGTAPANGLMARDPRVLYNGPGGVFPSAAAAANQTGSGTSSSSSSNALSGGRSSSGNGSAAAATAVRGGIDSTTGDENGAFVMWMGVDDVAQSLRLAGVATAGWADGPFSFRRSLPPDGNETRELAAHTDGRGGAFLTRIYLAEVEYVLPEPVMQPIWRSLSDDGADDTVNYGLSYHRAFYATGSDDYHDIYKQRWRLEDKPWEVYCVDRITGANRSVVYGAFRDDGSYCVEPTEYKLVLGQGYPLVESRYQDPRDAENSAWLPSSVPAVRAQPWSANYRDGSCGLLPDDPAGGIDRWDPRLADGADRPAGAAVVDRSSCSNVADNPPHPTPRDRLVGVQRAVETRLAEFAASSRLTPDLLETTGQLVAMEGRLEGAAASLQDLPALTADAEGPFGWWGGGGEEGEWALASAYRPPVLSGMFWTESDVRNRFHQYESRENDRAFYSTACVLDGECSVNFKDQVALS